MGRHIDIAALSELVVDSVRSPETEKTASAVPSLNTDVGRAFKKAADAIREYSDTGVTNDDLQELINFTRKHAEGTVGATMGGLAGSPAGMGGGGGGGNNPVNMAAPGPAPSNPTGQVAPKLGSALGNEYRKLAALVRQEGAAAEEARVVKAAQMITAATGIKHLVTALNKS